MRYGIEIAPWGEYADSRALARLAQSAEEAGWDGLFLWDAMLYDPAGLPKAGTLLGRKTGTRRNCRAGRFLTVRLSSTGQRLLRRHKTLPVEVRLKDPGNTESYITEIVAP